MIQGKSVALLLVVVCSIVYAQIDCAAGNYVSGYSFGYARKLTMTGGGTSQAFGVTASNGFLYATGNFSGSAQYSPPTVIPATGTFDAFVVKTSASSPTSATWFVKFGGTGASAQGNDIVVDSADNVYVTGAFTGNVTFGSFFTPVNNPRALFVAKLNSAGVVQWLFSMDISSEGLGIALDSNNNVYVTGFATGTTTLGGSSTTLSGGIVMALTNAGAFSWVNVCGAQGNQIAVSSSNELYVSGYFVSTFMYGATTVFTNAAATEGFAVKLSSGGALQWSARFGNSAVNAIAVNSNLVFVSGIFSGTATFDSISFTTPGGSSGTNGFALTIYATNGTIAGATHIRSTGASFSQRVTTDTNGNAYIAGYYSGALTVTTQNPPTTATTYNVIVTKFNAQGQYLWTVDTGGNSGHEFANDVAYDSSQQNIVFAGSHITSANFGNNLLSSTTRSMILVGFQPSCSQSTSTNYVPFAGYYTSIACTPGSYAVAGSSSCTLCPAGTSLASAGSSSSSCSTCPAGRFSSLPGSTSCSNCLAGNYSSTGATSCTPCNAGFYSSSSIATTCTPCNAGSYAPNTGSSSCTFCPAGSYSSSTGSSTCTLCSVGYYTSSSGGATSCTAASAGYYVAVNGASSQTACPAGTYSTSTAATSASTCTPCSAGTSSNRVGASSISFCSICRTGEYSAAGAASCTSCPAGTHGDSKFANQCFACPAGTYSETVGATSSSSCIKCKADSKLYSFANATKCDTCPEFCCVGDNQAGCYKCQKGTSDICNSLTSAEEQQNISAGVVFGSFFGMFAGLTALAIVLVICFSVMGVVFGMIAQRVPTTTNAAAPAPVTAENPVYTA